MRAFLLIFFGLVFIQGVYPQNPDILIRDIKSYVKAIDSLARFNTYLPQEEAPVLTEIIEGTMKSPKRNLKGGFSTIIVTIGTQDTVLIYHHDNLKKNLHKFYYFRNAKLVFSKIELKEDDGTSDNLFLREKYYNDDIVLRSCVERNKLKKKYVWRTNFDELAAAYYFLKEFNK